jgi:hypothetical protein
MASIFTKIACLIGLLSISVNVFFLEDIPTEGGVSGYINLGFATIKGKTNMIAGNSLGDIGQMRTLIKETPYTIKPEMMICWAETLPLSIKIFSAQKTGIC